MTHFSIFRVFRDDITTKTYLHVFATAATVFLFFVAVWPFCGDPLTKPLWFRIPFTGLGMLAVVSSFVIWFGMWSYWARFDPSKAWAKRIWFFILLLGIWFGGILYFLMVYIPQVARRRS